MKKYIYAVLMIFTLNIMYCDEKDYLYKKGTPESITNQMTIIQVKFNDYNGNDSTGTMVVNKKIAKEVIEIFDEIKSSGFQIEKVRPISEYEWNDDKSMEDNNTSAYNYRLVANTKKLSNHAYGMAIDINPRYNPMVIKNKVSPANGSYSKENKGTISADSQVVKIFKKRGWKWGGDYKSLKDYQHFEKILE